MNWQTNGLNHLADSKQFISMVLHQVFQVLPLMCLKVLFLGHTISSIH